ncbi:MAG: S8/S53 family peptidase [Thermoplasmatota archaeon]
MRFALLVTLALLTLTIPTTGPAAADAPLAFPHVVIAHIDTGINPYSKVFRDDGPLAYVHPSKYIAGYPADTPALWLHLNETDWATAFAKDRAIWDGLLDQWNHSQASLRGKMFWIPGTKIIGAVRFAPGGTNCPIPETTFTPPPWELNGNCPDYPLLDDFGHGTMTATRMAGNEGSLCPECRIVSIEGLGADQVQWAASRGWIDVQTNSWGSLLPGLASWAGDWPLGFNNSKVIENAAKTMPVYFASGNGIDGAFGFAPQPTEIDGTLQKDVMVVGAHDNGHVTLWPGAPAELVADGYGGLSGNYRSTDFFGPEPVTCCTSAAAPYAAGEGAAVLLEARKMLGDTSSGIHGGVVAHGTPPAGASALLADGVLNLSEFKSLVYHTADARPHEGRDDGWLHWMGGPSVPDPNRDVLPYGPGANAFCQGCWTLPVKWTDVPDSVPAYTLIGYGAANEFSLASATAVLHGAPEPDRSDVDAFFAVETQARDAALNPDVLIPEPFNSEIHCATGCQ